MAALAWRDARWAFERAGGLLSVCVIATNASDWDALLDYLWHGWYPVECTVGGEPVPFPPDAAAAFARCDPEERPGLVVDLGGVRLRGRLAAPDEIVFALDQWHAVGEAEFRRLAALMEDAAAVLDLPVLLTAGDSSDPVLLLAEPPPVRLVLAGVLGHSLNVYLAHGERVRWFNVFFLSDTVADLCAAAAALLSGDTRRSFPWADEPGEHRWVLERDGDRVQVRVVWFREFRTMRLHDTDGPVEFEAEYALADFARQVHDQMGHLLDRYGNAVLGYGPLRNRLGALL